MSLANAALTPKHRLRLARLIVEDGWPPSGAAEFFNVPWRTAAKWAQRYRGCRLNRLSHIDRVTGEPARRYERERPGELIHVDVTKFGNVPDGGGWRFVGRSQGDWSRQATRDRTGVKTARSKLRVGTCSVHTVIDDHSRVAYAEIHGDEQAVTAAGVLCRAVAWFAERGVTVEQVLSDNGPASRQPRTAVFPSPS